jgi:septum formation protein
MNKTVKNNSSQKKVYLASSSKPRRRLLSALGIPFKVVPLIADEAGGNGRKVKSFSSLVKSNALAKAVSVALKVKDGVIIAADTVAVKNGKIYGKPVDLKDAADMLRKLSGGSQQVYTGIVVLEKRRGETVKVEAACERTSVYMDRLSEREIKAYFSAVSPLDKAGSFDIQGRGALFIKSVRGCFYNVVGLPLRRLNLMLKRFGINMLAC